MRIVYAMHVNWQWIRQRPHALAEALAHEHDLRLLHARMFHSQHRSAEPPAASAGITASELQRLPGRLLELPAPLGPAFQWANQRWLAQQVRQAALQHRAELLWVTHPDFAGAAELLPDLPVVYDCMDDHAAFGKSDAAPVLAAEARLLQRADRVLFSSATLAARVQARSRVGRHEVVNNGVAESLLLRAVPPAPSMTSATAGPVLGYFGTLSSWFDWPLVQRVLQALPGVTLRLAGPVETAIPSHPRVQHVGVLRHDELADFVAGCDWLLMPFTVNRLIEAVDPVKLYEYIAFGRPVLAPRYAESERFLPWVQLYGDAEEAIAALRTPQPPQDRDGALRFLAGQTWSCRQAQIGRALAGLSPRHTAPAAMQGAAR